MNSLFGKSNHSLFPHIRQISENLVGKESNLITKPEATLNELSFIEVGYGQSRESSPDIHEVLTNIDVLSSLNTSQRSISEQNHISNKYDDIDILRDLVKSINQKCGNNALIVFNLIDVGDEKEISKMILQLLKHFKIFYKKVLCVTNGFQLQDLQYQTYNIFNYLEGSCSFSDLVKLHQDSKFSLIHCPTYYNGMKFHIRQRTFRELIDQCRRSFPLSVIVNNLNITNFLSTYCQNIADGIVLVANENADSHVTDWKQLNIQIRSRYLGWICVPSSTI